MLRRQLLYLLAPLPLYVRWLLVRLARNRTRTMQGMARVRSGQAAPDPWFLAGGRVEAPGSRAAAGRLRSKCEAPLRLGGARPDTQRAIPGPVLYRRAYGNPPRHCGNVGRDRQHNAALMELGLLGGAAERLH